MGANLRLGRFLKPAILLILIALAVVLYKSFGRRLSLEALADREQELHAYKESHPLIIFGSAYLLYTIVMALSLPISAGLTLAYGWFFGFFAGVVLVSFASTSGATLAFLLSRYFFRDVIQKRFADRLVAVNRALDREGTFYLFWLRLIPAVPPAVINLVMGLTRMRVVTFWWVSQVGMFAGTCLYVYAGASVPTLRELAAKGPRGILTPQIFIAFTLLGVFPIVVKKLVDRKGAARDQPQ